MRRFLVLGFFFIVCLLIALVFNMPLVHVLAEVKLPPNIRVSNFDGSVLKGRIDALEVNNLQATGIEYRHDPRCIITLKWCYELIFDQGEGRASANALGRNITITDTNLAYSVSELVTLFPALLVKPTGDVELVIDRLIVNRKQVLLESGALIWKNAGVEGETVDLGEYRVDAVLQNEAYNFKISDNDSLLNIDGRGQLKANGQYTVDINIESEPGLRDSIKTALEFVARQRGLNQYSVSQSGNIPPRMISRISFGKS